MRHLKKRKTAIAKLTPFGCSCRPGPDFPCRGHVEIVPCTSGKEEIGTGHANKESSSPDAVSIQSIR